MQNQKSKYPAADEIINQLCIRSVQSLFDSYPEAVFLMEPSGRIVDANMSFVSRMNTSLQECIGINVYDLLPPELAARRRQKGEEIMRTGKLLSFEDERNNRTLQHTVYPVRSPDGTIDHLLIIAEDITDLKQTRLSLVNEQALNNALIEATPGIICLIDAEGRLAAWNPYLRDAIVGKSENEMACIEALTLIHPDDRALVHEKMQNVFLNDVEDSAEARVLLRGGPEFRWLVFKGKRVIIDNKSLMIGIGTDITERKRAEETLRESEMHYQDLFTNMTNGFAYCRLIYEGKKAVDFVCEQINRQAELLTGQINVVGRRVSDIVPGIHQANPEPLERYARVATTGVPERFEFYLKERNIWFDLSVYSPKKGYVAIVFDVITERKRTEAALKKSEQKFRTITEQMSEMVFVTDKSGRFTYVSPVIEDIFGYKPHEAIGHLFTEYQYLRI